MTSLAAKLGLRPGQVVCLLEAHGPAANLLTDALPEGVDLLYGAGNRRRCDVIFFWPRALEGLEARFAALQWDMEPDGALWVVMPKQAAARKRGHPFSWNEMQAAALSTDLVDNKIASLDQEEYATRFVIRRERRHAYVDPGAGLS
jgi:hypothetical protein